MNALDDPEDQSNNNENCKKESKCEHGKNRRSGCKECGRKAFCEHGRIRASCKDCGGKAFCEHGRRRARCKGCGRSRKRIIAVALSTDCELDQIVSVCGTTKKPKFNRVHQLLIENKTRGSEPPSCALCISK